MMNYKMIAVCVGIAVLPVTSSYAGGKGHGTLHDVIADQHSTVETLEALIAQGADLNSLNSEGYTPLEIAAAMDQVLMAKSLVVAGADIEKKSGKEGRFPLYTAAEFGKRRMVKFLLEKGAGVDKTADRMGITPFQAAISYSPPEGNSPHLTIARLLLEKGANINHKSKTINYTALHLAVLKANVKAVRFLFDYGADVNSRDVWGKTPLETLLFESSPAMLKSGPHAEILRLMLKPKFLYRYSNATFDQAEKLARDEVLSQFQEARSKREASRKRHAFKILSTMEKIGWMLKCYSGSMQASAGGEVLNHLHYSVLAKFLEGTTESVLELAAEAISKEITDHAPPFPVNVIVGTVASYVESYRNEKASEKNFELSFCLRNYEWPRFRQLAQRISAAIGEMRIARISSEARKKLPFQVREEFNKVLARRMEIDNRAKQEFSEQAFEEELLERIRSKEFLEKIEPTEPAQGFFQQMFGMDEPS